MFGDKDAVQTFHPYFVGCKFCRSSFSHVVEECERPKSPTYEVEPISAQSYVFRSSTTRATTMGYSHLLLMHRLFFDAGKGGGNVEARVVSDNSDVFLISKEKSSEFQKGALYGWRRDKPGMGLEAHFMT